MRWIILDPKSRDGIKRLSREQKWELLDAIFSYNIDWEIVEMSDIVWMAFDMMKWFFDSQIIAYNETCAKNRENVMKRWEKGKDTTVYDGIEKDTTVYEPIPNIPIKRKEIKRNKIKENINNTPEVVLSPLEEKIEEFVIFRKTETKVPLGPIWKTALIKKLSKFPDDIAIQMINESIENWWKWVFELKNNFWRKQKQLEEYQKPGARDNFEFFTPEQEAKYGGVVSV